MFNIPAELWLALAPLGRALAGWIENALRDNVIDWPEWRQLILTIVRLGVPSLALYYGLNMSLEMAAALPVIADYAMSIGRRLWESKKAPVAA